MTTNITKANLSHKLPSVAFVLCIIQPLLDAASYFLSKAEFSNIPTLFLRFGILVLILVLGFTLSERKRIYLYVTTVLVFYTLLHCFACYLNGYSSPLTDLTNLIRIYQMPLICLSFITFIKVNKRVYHALKLGVIACLFIIVAIEIISVVSGTNPYTYENKSIGIIGWFFDSSAQSAILSCIVPVFIAYVAKEYKNNVALLVLSIFGSCLVLFLYATRLAYIALIITLLGLLVTYIIKDRKAIKPILCLLLTLVVFIIAIPFSPMQKNQKMVSDNAVIKQNNINSLIEQNEIKASSMDLNDTEYKLFRLRGAYDEYLGAMTDRFGMERVAEAYSYSEKASDICDVRRMKNTYCRMLIEDQGILSMLFGCEIADMTHNGQVFDVENDLHGIFYLCGGTGLILTLLFLLYFILLIFKALIKDFKNIFSIESAGLGISLITLFLHIYATCGVLRRPSASIYLSIILTAVYSYVHITKKGLSNDQ